MNPAHQAEQLFHGAIADDYHFLLRICPSAAEMSRRVGEFVAAWAPPGEPDAPLQLLEIGCGTGLTTLRLLHTRPGLHVLSVDNAPAMLAQARENLAAELTTGQLELRQSDALSALQALPDAAVDIVASAYTLHNFLHGYRSRVLAEILRVLKPGGVFVNGDRYAIDEPAEHLRLIQEEVRGYFRVFIDLQRLDLLEQWVVHLFSDESEEHLMRLRPALDEMARLGFADIQLSYRDGVNALVNGMKPWR